MTATALPEISSDRLNEFRRTYIRDLWDGTTGLSRFNQANKKNFFEDDDLRLLDQRVSGDQVEELNAAYEDKEAEREAQGDSDTAAAAAGEVVRWEARFRLLRAACYRVMMGDAAFRASLIVGDRSGLAEKLFENWTAQIEEDETWARSRSGEYNMIHVERM